jgi:DNA-binding LytR/AlgR family response regulator
MGYEVPATFNSGKQTLENFKPGFADIIIMDIQLADNTNGIDTSIEIRKISTAPIIYITDNKDEYLRKKAIYETNTVQYITKPFTRLDISIAIDLAIKAIKGHNLMLEKANNSSYLINECIFVKDIQGFKKILISDIVFLKAEGSYCNLFYKINYKNGEKKNDTKTDDSILFSENLSFWKKNFLLQKSWYEYTGLILSTLTE